jgi:hypothetical protein
VFDSSESEGSYGCNGGYNDDDFDAAAQCCACGGGTSSGPGWEYIPGDFEFTSWIKAADVQDENGSIISDGDILAAFDASGTVRGIAVQITPTAGPYAGSALYEMTMGSNADGDEISFQYYDASEDALLGIDETITFETNAQLGDIGAPVILSAVAFDYGCPECDDSCVDGSLVGGPDCASAFGMGAASSTGHGSGQLSHVSGQAADTSAPDQPHRPVSHDAPIPNAEAQSGPPTRLPSTHESSHSGQP